MENSLPGCKRYKQIFKIFYKSFTVHWCVVCKAMTLLLTTRSSFKDWKTILLTYLINYNVKYFKIIDQNSQEREKSWNVLFPCKCIWKGSNFVFKGLALASVSNTWNQWHKRSLITIQDLSCSTALKMYSLVKRNRYKNLFHNTPKTI